MKSGRFRRWLLALALAAAGCSKKEADPNTPGSAGGGPAGARGTLNVAEIEAVPVETELARTGSVSDSLSYNSTLEVETSVTVFSEVSGLVETILVEEGDRVTVGQPLLLLEHDEQKVDLRESEANLAQLEQTRRRTQELFDRGLVNRQEFDTQNFQLEQARLSLERAKLRVEQATVRAPVAGVITERFAQPGARVGANTELFGLMSLDDVIARVFVPGRHLTTVREGQEARLTSEFLPGRVFSGWVKRISPIVDPASGTFKVTVGVRPDENPPPPGLFVSVRVVTDRRENAVLIPKRALIYEGGERFIFVVREGTASRVRLDAGYEEGDSIEALTNIEPGDPIVVLGQSALKDGARVRATNATGSGAAVANPTPVKTVPGEVADS